MKLRNLALIFLFLLTGSCSSQVLDRLQTAPVQSPKATTPPAAPTRAAGPVDTPTPQQPVTLRIWLPPQFDPEANTPAGDLLRARLDEFAAGRPDVRLEVRVKAQDGPGGLLESLTTTSAAAPLALPDLVAIPHSMVDVAALKGLLHPINGIVTDVNDKSWFEYARQIAHLQNSVYGIPFAGDVLLIVHRSKVIAAPATTWEKALKTTVPLMFNADDPQSLLTLTLYQAKQGAVQDDQGRPFLDAKILAEVLTFFQEGSKNSLLPYWLTQYQTADQTWTAFTENRSDMVIAWSSRYLQQTDPDLSIAPIPTADGEPFTLATGWAWAIASPTPERQQLSAQLAEFLIQSDFLAKWTEAAGYIPPTTKELDLWSNKTTSAALAPIAASAHIYPSKELLTSLGPALQQATVKVLKNQSDPQTAAQTALEALNGP